MIRATDIHSLTEFTRNAKRFVTEVKASRKPLALTVNGEAELVVQDVRSYQLMVDELERMRLITAIRASEMAVSEGRVQELGEAFDGIRDRLGL